MTKFVWTLAALALIAAPSVSMAQSAPPNPSVPRPGNQAPVVQQKESPALAGALANPSIPGSGYRIPEVRPGQQPLAAHPRDPLAEYLSNSERYGK